MVEMFPRTRLKGSMNTTSKRFLLLPLIISLCELMGLVDGTGNPNRPGLGVNEEPEEDNVDVMMFQFSVWHPSMYTSTDITDNDNRERFVDPVLQALELFICDEVNWYLVNDNLENVCTVTDEQEDDNEDNTFMRTLVGEPEVRSTLISDRVLNMIVSEGSSESLGISWMTWLVFYNVLQVGDTTDGGEAIDDVAQLLLDAAILDGTMDDYLETVFPADPTYTSNIAAPRMSVNGHEEDTFQTSTFFQASDGPSSPPTTPMDSPADPSGSVVEDTNDTGSSPSRGRQSWLGKLSNDWHSKDQSKRTVFILRMIGVLLMILDIAFCIMVSCFVSIHRRRKAEAILQGHRHDKPKGANNGIDDIESRFEDYENAGLQTDPGAKYMLEVSAATIRIGNCSSESHHATKDNRQSDLREEDDTMELKQNDTDICKEIVSCDSYLVEV